MDSVKAASVLVLVTAGLLACDASGKRGGDQPPALRLPQSTASLGNPAAQAPAVLAANPARYDFGMVPISGGTVMTRYLVTNVADRPVRLRGVYTSCGCTTAKLTFSDETVAGPFGMPGHELPVSYDRLVQPGESFEVQVRFDPASHGPRGLGDVMRSVVLEPVNDPPLEFVLTATVFQS